jgi:Xaa-Pro aminopeptidase
MGPQPTLRDLAERTGFDHIKPADELLSSLRGKDISCLPPYRTEHFRLHQQITEHCDCSVRPAEELIMAVIELREVKAEGEVAQMEEALQITREMHVKVMKTAKAGIRESVLAGIAEGIAIANQGRLAYSAIVTRNGQILHNHEHHNILAEGDLVLCDMGSENKMRYAADITRTFPVSGRFSAKQKDIYNIVLEAEIKGINACRAGTPYAEVHKLASTIIADGLIGLGLMKGNAEDAVEAGAHALFFPHGLGHLIGLDVHDMEGLGEDRVGYSEKIKRSDLFGTAYLRLGKALKAGHVLTVEPGIYFIPQLIELWKSEGKFNDFIAYDKLGAYSDFGGIRIEDNVLVTSGSPRVLGKAIPKSVEEIEEVMRS